MHFAWLPQPNCQIFKVQKTFSKCCTWLLNKALQTLKRTPVDCDKTSFNKTIFHRFHVHSIKLVSPHLNDRKDSGSIMDTLILQRLHQSHSLETFRELNNTDAEKLKNEVVNVFNQTEFDNSPDSEVSAKKIFLDPHGCFRDVSAIPNTSQTNVLLTLH